MGKRRKARELAVQVLFHLEFNPGDPEEAFDLICENFEASKSVRPFSKELVVGVWENRQELDELIQGASRNWRVSRMPRLDRSILRLAAYEILYAPGIPPKVSIDEAVEMGKRLGSEDTSSFVNGILDNIYNNLFRPEKCKA
jgi:transcription antitermination factor NusB